MTEDFAKRGAEAAELDEPGEDGEENAGADEQYDHRPAPYIPVQRTLERQQLIHARF
jgi:hypothetical protein